MNNTDLDNIYKSALPTSHFAGLRACFDAGYFAGASQNVTASTPDVSLTQPAPTADVTITAP